MVGAGVGGFGALGAGGPGALDPSSSVAFKVTRTVSFFKGTLDVFFIGFGGFGGSLSESLIGNRIEVVAESRHRHSVLGFKKMSVGPVKPARRKTPPKASISSRFSKFAAAFPLEALVWSLQKQSHILTSRGNFSEATCA
jgi:hypothetical protein